MKKKFLLILSILLALIVIGINLYNSQIPDLKLTQGINEIKILKCPYSWNTLFKHEKRNYTTPFELTHTFSPLLVRPNTILNLNFNRKPNNFEITLWRSNTSAKVQITSSIICTPLEKGIYVYRIDAYWKQGVVAYLFKINVE